MKVICDISVTSARNRSREGWHPGYLFRGGAQGAWYDPASPTTLFEDAAGTVPISQPGAPVGRINDFSGSALDAMQSGLARPVYCITPASGRRNLSDKSEPAKADLTNSQGVLDAAQPLAEFDNTISVPGGNVGNRVAYRNHGVEASVEYTLSCFIAMDDGNAPNPGVDFTLAIGNVSAGGGWGAVIDMGDGTWRVSRTLTSSTSNLSNTGVLKTDAHSIRGFRVSGFQLETGPDVTPYQRARSIFDLQETGVRSLSALDFDGVDDSLLTGTLDLSQTSEVTVVAGVEKFSNPTSRGTVVNFVDNGFQNFSLEVPMPGSANTRWLHAGVSTLRRVTAPFQTNTRSIMTGMSNLDTPYLELRQDGVSVGLDSSTTGGGPFKSGPVAIGDYVAPTGRRLHGRLFGLLVIDRVLSAKELAQIEAWMGRRTGVVL